MKRVVGFLMVMALLVAGERVRATETIKLAVYTSYVPIIVNEQQHSGLAYSVADILTKRSNGRYVFVVSVLPRRRVDFMLDAGEAMVVPFISPLFFGDVKREKYQWTSPLFFDQQVIAFNPARPVNYTGPDSLRGKSLGGIIGYRYAPLDALTESRAIVREDVSQDEQNLAKLAMGRIDAVSISSLSFNYLKTNDIRFNVLEASPVPLYPIERRFLVQGRPDVRDFIESAIADSSVAADWKAAFSMVYPR